MEYVNTIDALSQVPTQTRGTLSPVDGVNKGCINRPVILNIEITFRSMEQLKCDCVERLPGWLPIDHSSARQDQSSCFDTQIGRDLSISRDQLKSTATKTAN